MDELSTKYVPPHYSTANFSQTYNIISASTQPLLLFSKKSCTCNTVFQSFLSYDNNQDADRTSTYNKRVIELLTNRKHFSNLIKIWENTDG